MRNFVCFLVLIFSFTVGCTSGNKSRLSDAELGRIALARKIRLVEASGGLVLTIGGETITSDEIIQSPAELGGTFVVPVEYFKAIAQVSEPEQFRERARGQLKEVLTNKILNILLYQQARRELGKNNIDEVLDKEAQKAIRKVVLDFGGDQNKADEAIRQSGMDWKKFKENQKKTILNQWYISTKMPNDKPITYRELRDYYDSMKDEFFAKAGIIRFRLIDIQPNEIELTNPDDDSHQLAVKLASELMARIRSGEDFEELARQYSHGPMRGFGGLWRPVQPGSLAAPYDKIAAEAENMEPGQIAGPIEAEGHIFIMRLEEKQSAGYEPFGKVQMQVKNRINLERRSEVIDNMNARLLQQAEFGRTDEFIDFCLEKIYQKSRQ